MDEDSFVSAKIENCVEAQTFQKWVQQSFPFSQNSNQLIKVD